MRRRRSLVLRGGLLFLVFLALILTVFLTPPSVPSGVLFFSLFFLLVFLPIFYFSGERGVSFLLGLMVVGYLILRAMRLDTLLNVGLWVLALVLLWLYFRE